MTWFLWLLVSDLLGLLVGYGSAHGVFHVCSGDVCDRTLGLSILFIGAVRAAGLILVSGLAKDPGVEGGLCPLVDGDARLHALQEDVADGHA